MNYIDFSEQSIRKQLSEFFRTVQWMDFIYLMLEHDPYVVSTEVEVKLGQGFTFHLSVTGNGPTFEKALQRGLTNMEHALSLFDMGSSFGQSPAQQLIKGSVLENTQKNVSIVLRGSYEATYQEAYYIPVSDAHFYFEKTIYVDMGDVSEYQPQDALVEAKEEFDYELKLLLGGKDDRG